MNHNYRYYSDWGRYSCPEGSEVSTDGDIRETFDAVDLSQIENFPSCGIPLLKEGDRVYVNGRTDNTVIFGETGCGKSRRVISPLTALVAGAGESAFVTDVKGELYANKKLRLYLKERGVRTVCLDFRSFDKDRYDILKHPFGLFRKGDVAGAESEVARILKALSSKYEQDDEPIWADQAVGFLSALIEFMFVIGSDKNYEEYVNMLTLVGLANMNALGELTRLVDQYGGLLADRMTGENFSALINIISNPADRMIGSVMAFVHSMIRPFAAEPALTEMLSVSTFSVESVYDTPTCVFLIIPDETSAYDMVSGLLIDTFYSRLIETYGKKYMCKREPPCRVNFICDEFCNMRINDMRSKISASRSRCIRWYLVCQSRAQLESTYHDDAATIIGNCRNMLFLQSCDKELIDYFCSLCGETYMSGSESPTELIRPEILRGLRMDREIKEALFISGSTVYFAELHDIDSYDLLKKYEGRLLGKPRQIRRSGQGVRYLDIPGIAKALSCIAVKQARRLLDIGEDLEDDDCGDDRDIDISQLAVDPQTMFDDPDETIFNKKRRKKQ